MKIETMLVPCAQWGKTKEQSKDDPRLVEVEVAHTFSRVINGREFHFCVHPDVETASLWTLSHYETGQRLGAWSDSADVELSIMAGAKLGRIIKDHGERKVRQVIEAAAPIVNGCMTCSGTRWASVGGPCITCRGSGKAREPKP